jgi:hypothetical protein
MNFVVESIANQTNLTIGEDIKLISNTDYDDLYSFFEANPNRVQYAISFCFSR